ncbi:AfsR/SARP family transcriptional regulator [Streptomyces sp.]|uniref:AfsR/SARP family transcriptional regulator n=1 Tax=Streptomyces sp. TaxID=1931 RepID=UPI002F3EA024
MGLVRLLGSLEYRTAAGEAVDLGQSRQRAIFAMLAVNANEAVPTSELIDWTWGSEPPQSARNMVHSYISRLRGVFEAAGPPSEATVLRRHGGYVLEVDERCVDVHSFRRRVALARAGGDDVRGSVLLFRQALAVWQDTALGGVAGTWADEVRRLLELERLSVLVECHEVELRLGGHRELLPELRTTAERYPDNEIVIRNLMTALHRSGHQAEALGVYAGLRRRLVSHLGVDPDSETQELYTRILRAGPGPAAKAPQAPRVAPAAARIPHQLPRGPRLVGREQELAMLDGFVASAAAEPSIRVIEGPPGIGKTALAVHWGHRVAPRFPDGQVFVDLHGSEGDQDIQEPEALIRLVLRSLGVPCRVTGPDELAELYRDTVTDRRLLIVLDDLVCDEGAVRLLKGVTAGAVVVTTRCASSLRELEALRSVRFLRLRELSNRQAERMLAGILGEARVEAEEETMTRIIELCGRTPQALTAVAEHALGRPRLSLADLTMTMALCVDRPAGGLTPELAERAAEERGHPRSECAGRPIACDRHERRPPDA